MKTYSIAFKRNNVWTTNWGEYSSLDEINWNEVDAYCKEKNYQAYGYYYGHNSRNLKSKRCRTVVKELQIG